MRGNLSTETALTLPKLDCVEVSKVRGNLSTETALTFPILDAGETSPKVNDRRAINNDPKRTEFYFRPLKELLSRHSKSKAIRECCNSIR